MDTRLLKRFRKRYALYEIDTDGVKSYEWKDRYVWVDFFIMILTAPIFFTYVVYNLCRIELGKSYNPYYLGWLTSVTFYNDENFTFKSKEEAFSQMVGLYVRDLKQYRDRKKNRVVITKKKIYYNG